MNASTFLWMLVARLQRIQPQCYKWGRMLALSFHFTLPSSQNVSPLCKAIPFDKGIYLPQWHGFNLILQDLQAPLSSPMTERSGRQGRVTGETTWAVSGCSLCHPFWLMPAPICQLQLDSLDSESLNRTGVCVYSQSGGDIYLIPHNSLRNPEIQLGSPGTSLQEHLAKPPPGPQSPRGFWGTLGHSIDKFCCLFHGRYRTFSS